MGHPTFGICEAAILGQPQLAIFIRVDRWPRKCSVRESFQTLGDPALRPVQAGQEQTGCLTNPIGDNAAQPILKVCVGLFIT